MSHQQFYLFYICKCEEVALSNSLVIRIVNDENYSCLSVLSLWVGIILCFNKFAISGFMVYNFLFFLHKLIVYCRIFWPNGMMTLFLLFEMISRLFGNLKIQTVKLYWIYSLNSFSLHIHIYQLSISYFRTFNARDPSLPLSWE